jgi:Ca-activated chloride channel family protein
MIRRTKVSEPELSTTFAPVAAKSGQAIELAMQRLWLVGRILPVGARLLVRHTFRSGEKKPLEVIYSFGLPRDAALRRFRITGQGFSVSSDLKPVEEAVEQYEKGLERGHLAAMARQYGDGLVNLTVGNIRPAEAVAVTLEILAGVETRDDGIRFRFPFTLAPMYHARARAAEVAPGAGEIELPADEFGDVVLPQFVSDASALHQVGFDLSIVMGSAIVETGSPSHAVRVAGHASDRGRSRVSLATAKDLPNRDLVLDVRTADSMAGVIGGTASDGKGYFAAVAPSVVFKGSAEGAEKEVPRRVVFVLDRSGSMGGVPIGQARKAVEACLGALGERDLFGIVAFDDFVENFTPALVEASMKNREKARNYLAGIDARGGTELAAGIRAAADMFGKDMPGGEGGDLFVVTDGQVAGTEKIIEVARSAGVRLHCLGIGSASQDRFLSQLARETDGVSRFLTPRERVDFGAVEVFASIGRPLARGLEAKVEGIAEGTISPGPPAFVFNGTPVVLWGDTAGPGEGRLVMGWESGGGRRSAVLPLTIGGRGGERREAGAGGALVSGEGETVRLLRGARLISDLESRVAAEGAGVGKRREEDRITRRLRALSEEYGLASRPMALVAVVKRAGDRPGELPVTRVVPVGLAQDVLLAGYFGRDSLVLGAGQPCMLHAEFDKYIEDVIPDLPGKERVAYRKGFSLRRLMTGKVRLEQEPMKPVGYKSVSDVGDSEAALMALASTLEPDGGMPGKTEETRMLATILALLQFLAGGHSVSGGAFRAHVKRLVEFLEAWLKRSGERPGKSAGELEEAKLRVDVVKQIVERGHSGRALPGDWSKRHPEPELWKDLAAALRPI